MQEPNSFINLKKKEKQSSLSTILDIIIVDVQMNDDYHLDQNVIHLSLYLILNSYL
jgi:hypothetical protein